MAQQTPPGEREAEYLANIIGDKPEPFGTRVVVVDYDPRWPRSFEGEADRVRAALGPVAVRVEHMGSTSVPGLAAKPIIDICLAVPDSADEDSYAPALQEAGFVFRIREADWHEHRVFYRRTDWGHAGNANLHVLTAGCLEYERKVVFRDWLRAHDDDRDLYARTKRDLAAREWKYVQDYADAKTGVISQIMARAGEPAGKCPEA